jgi:predicted dehydrogenase
MIRVAIIGLGAVTHNIHLPAYSRLKNRVSIVAGCDPNSEARRRARENWKLPEVFDDPQKMLEATAPDVVSVCTPPSLHHEQTLMALEHGCHVFCEKPMSDSLVQADEMIQASDAADRLVVINTQFPYMKIHSAAKKIIGSAEFGRLLFIQAWQSFRPTDHTEAGWRGELQRRLCFEFGIHVFELIRYFFDANPSKILAHMPHLTLGLKSDSVNIIYVEFPDGRAASIVLNRISKAPERYLDLRLDGEHASVHTSIGGRVQVSAGVHTRERKPFLRLGFAQ